MHSLVIRLPVLSELWMNENNATACAQLLQLQRFEFAVVDRSHKKNELLRRGSASFEELPKQMSIELLLDARDVSMFDCQLPALPRQRLRSVVESLAEDQLACGVAGVWLAFEPGLSGASSGVIGVRRDWLSLCLNVFATLGHVVWVLPDVLSLPSPDDPNAWTLWLDGDSCKIMTHPYRSFVLPIALAREYLAAFLQQQPAAKISKIYVSDQAKEILSQWQSDSLGFAQIFGDNVLIVDGFEPFLTRSGFNLLQDEFSTRRGGFFKNAWWRRSAYIWGATISLALGVTYWQTHVLTQQMLMMRSAIQQQARLVIAPQVPLLDPVAQLKSMIKKTSQSQPDPLLGLMQAADQLLQGKNGKIVQLSYQSGDAARLTLRLDPPLAQDEQKSIESNARQMNVMLRWQSGRMEIGLEPSKATDKQMTVNQAGRGL